MGKSKSVVHLTCCCNIPQSTRVKLFRCTDRQQKRLHDIAMGSFGKSFREVRISLSSRTVGDTLGKYRREKKVKSCELQILITTTTLFKMRAFFSLRNRIPTFSPSPRSCLDPSSMLPLPQGSQRSAPSIGCIG